MANRWISTLAARSRRGAKAHSEQGTALAYCMQRTRPYTWGRG
jgi:hypothetical protein